MSLSLHCFTIFRYTFISIHNIFNNIPKTGAELNNVENLPFMPMNDAEASPRYFEQDFQSWISIVTLISLKKAMLFKLQKQFICE